MTASNGLRLAITAALVATLTACGGGSSGSSGTDITPPPATVHSALLIHDAANQDWAVVGVKVISITLTQQGGGTTSVYSTTSPAPVNLAQLDEVEDLISGDIPAGTYTGATITIAANPGDVTLVTGQDPQTGFIGGAGTTIPTSEIQINGATGASGALTTTIPISFATPLNVTGTQTTPVEIDFNLGHPAFVITTATTGGTPVYSVSFDGGTVVTGHHGTLQSKIALSRAYGSVASVSSDNSTITVNREVPTMPPVSPETAVASGTTLALKADATNGTLYYDLDQAAVAPTTIKDFSSVASTLPNRQVRAHARFQADGSLVLTRLYVANDFNTVWLSPQGHVLRVNPTAGTITITSDTGLPQTLNVTSSTQFVLPNQPASTPPIGTGTAFLSNIVRGFKIDASVDPANPTNATVVEIQAATFGGRIENATSSVFTFAPNFGHAADDYQSTLDYISSTTANGTDPQTGANITGFKYWDDLYPTLVTYTNGTTNAVTNFVAAVGGTVSFGQSPIYARGITHAVWGDAANPTGWSAPWVVLTPTRLPFAQVAGTLSGTNQFTVTTPGGSQAITVDLATGSGSATLVYSVDCTTGSHSVTPVDVTTSAGLSAVQTALAVGTPVLVTGIPQADGTLRAYTLTYFTGTQPHGAF